MRMQAFPRIDIDDKADEKSGPLATEPLPAVAVDRRADDPLAALKKFLQSPELRVLIAAESPGRRETMANYFAEYGLKPEPCASFEDFTAEAVPLHARRFAPGARLHRAWREMGGRHRGRALRRRGAPARSHRGEAQLGRGHAARPFRAQDRRAGGARAARHRPLPGPHHPERRRRQHGVPAARVRRRRQALRAGVAARRDRPLQRRATRGSAAAQAGQRPVGQGQGARRARRCATPPPNYCRCTRSAPHAWATRSRFEQHDLRSVRRRLRLRGNRRTRRRRSRR